MKKYITLTLVLLVLFSCAKKEQNIDTVLATDNLKVIRNYRAIKASEKQKIDAELKKIDAKIAVLDTIKKLPLITVSTIKDTLFTHYLELQGNVETKKLMNITPEFNGILSRVYIKEGQYVNRGQTLAKIDDGGLSHQLAQTQIQVDLAKTTFERQQRLWKNKIGSEMQFLQAKSNYEAQKKMIDQIQQQIAKTVVKAPFSGKIDEIITEQGNVVAAGQTPLFKLVNLANMYVETEVPESHIKNVTKNKKVLVNFPVLDKQLVSKVRQVGSFINPANRTFKVEIAVPNKDRTIKPNLTAKIKINDYTNKNAILIPQSIITEDAEGRQYVFIIKAIKNNIGTAQKVFIQTGKSQGDTIEVLKGLENSNKIVIEGARNVKDAQEVKIKVKDNE